MCTLFISQSGVAHRWGKCCECSLLCYNVPCCKGLWWTRAGRETEQSERARVSQLKRIYFCRCNSASAQQGSLLFFRQSTGMRRKTFGFGLAYTEIMLLFASWPVCVCMFTGHYLHMMESQTTSNWLTQEVKWTLIFIIYLHKTTKKLVCSSAWAWKKLIYKKKVQRICTSISLCSLTLHLSLS